MMEKKSEEEGFIDKGEASVGGNYHRYNRLQESSIAGIVEKLKTMTDSRADKYVQGIKRRLKNHRYKTRERKIDKILGG